MSVLAYIVIFTLIGSVVSLIGGVLLLAREKLAIRISHYLASFAAGALLGTAFFDLLPEAQEQAEAFGGTNIFIWTLVGILSFFLLERFIHWFHHHHDHTSTELKKEAKSIVPLVILGDSVHNFIDGVVIAATFLVNIPLGIVTTLAVAAHEIPQEIGDFGILLHRGMKRGKVLLVNFLSALAALAGALLTYLAGESIEVFLPILLSLSAGFFIYIAASDLIPEIHNEDKRVVALTETLLLLLGVLTIWFTVTSLQLLGVSA
ncbi:ZIP family metal transporter [Candidatus Daviesbacteria bacterium]|nr:ZIP family metal transporter [Candidatus Daviesbacteria bacterium]